jgi:hypothetical protein
MEKRIHILGALFLALTLLAGCSPTSPSDNTTSGISGEKYNSYTDTSLVTTWLKPLIDAYDAAINSSGLGTSKSIARNRRTVSDVASATDLSAVHENGYISFTTELEENSIGNYLDLLRGLINYKGITSDFDDTIDGISVKVKLGSESDSSSSTRLYLKGSQNGYSFIVFAKVNNDADKNYAIYIYNKYNGTEDYNVTTGSITKGSCKSEAADCLTSQTTDSDGNIAMALVSIATSSSSSDTGLYQMMGYMTGNYAGVYDSLTTSHNGTEYNSLSREYYKNGDLLLYALESPNTETPARTELSWDMAKTVKHYPLKSLQVEDGYTMKVDTQSSGRHNFWLEKSGGANPSAYNASEGDIDLITSTPDASGYRVGNYLYGYRINYTATTDPLNPVLYAGTVGPIVMGGMYSDGVIGWENYSSFGEIDATTGTETITKTYYQALQLGRGYNLSTEKKTHSLGEKADLTPYVKLWPAADTTTVIATVEGKLTTATTGLKDAVLTPLAAKLSAGVSGYSQQYQDFVAGTAPTKDSFFK